MTPFRVDYVSHACLKVRGEFGVLLCDPWLLNEPVFNLTTWKFPPARLDPQDVVRDIDYLLITHSHEDHFHIPSLNLIRRDVPVLLSAYAQHPSLRAHTIERVLRKLGFTNIRRFSSWQRLPIGQKSALTFVPSAASRDQDWENLGFVLEHPGVTLLNINDNVNDETLCGEIHERFPNIDIAVIQTGGVTMYPGCFRMSREKMQEEALKRTLAFREQRRLLDIVAPKVIAPFAGDFCWLDDRYAHNNWANRTTPKLLANVVNGHYGNKNIHLVMMQPGDSWSKDQGLVQNSRRVDWDNYLEEIKVLQGVLRPKIQRVSDWLRDVSFQDLKVRSLEHTRVVATHITKDYIDFAARFRIAIEGQNSNFSFVTKADPVQGFRIDWNDHDPVQQTLYVPEEIWANILAGKLMWNIIQWSAQAEQEIFTRDMGRFWFWMEYHIDLNSKNIQAIIADELWPDIRPRIRPNYGVFPVPDEWQAVRRLYDEF